MNLQAYDDPAKVLSASRRQAFLSRIISFCRQDAGSTLRFMERAPSAVRPGIGTMNPVV